jgi:hypothetical protein
MSLSLRVHVGHIRSSIFLLRLTWILNFGLVARARWPYMIQHFLASFNMNFKLWLGMVANSAVSLEFSFNRKVKLPEEGVLC